MPITFVPDHAAVAVPAIERAAARWHDELGGAWLGPRFDLGQAGFATRQLHYPGGAKLELLEPVDPEGFAARFLERRGAGLHHVTLKVPDLLAAVDELRGHGLDVVDVFAEGDIWHEAFLRPSQIGGLIVQVAWQGRSDEEWAELMGVTPEPARDDGARLLGPTLSHPDLDEAARIWGVLGARVEHRGDHLDVRWSDAPLSVRVVAGEQARSLGLRFKGAPGLPRDPEAGAAIIPVF